MNANRNMTIKFLVNGELDHVIQPKKGRSVKHRATKPKKIFKKDITKEEILSESHE